MNYVCLHNPILLRNDLSSQSISKSIIHQCHFSFFKILPNTLSNGASAFTLTNGYIIHDCKKLTYLTAKSPISKCRRLI